MIPDFETVVGLFNYWVVIFLMMTGFYIVIGQRNLIKSIIGLNLFQTSVFLLYITMGKVRGGTAPIIPPEIAEAMEHAHAGHDEHAVHAGEATHAGDHKHEDAAGHSAAGHVDHGPHGDVSTSEGHLSHGDGGSHSQHEASDGIETVGEHATEHLETAGELIYSNPLPSVLMLTAIVVGIATTALALALIVRIREDYGTIEEDEILAIDAAEDAL